MAWSVAAAAAGKPVRGALPLTTMAAHGFMPSILLVKDVPPNLPLNISGMEQGWILYRCDRAQALRPPTATTATTATAAASSEQPADPCMLVNMNKVQRKYDLAQHALGWQRQRIEGWRLAARLDDDDRLVSVRGSAWHFSEFLVVEDDNTLTLPHVEGATLVYAAVYGESPQPSPPPPPPRPPPPLAESPPPPQLQPQQLQQQQPQLVIISQQQPTAQAVVAAPPPSPQPRPPPQPPSPARPLPPLLPQPPAAPPRTCPASPPPLPPPRGPPNPPHSPPAPPPPPPPPRLPPSPPPGRPPASGVAPASVALLLLLLLAVGLTVLRFAQPPSARGAECQAGLVKLLPPQLLDHLRPLIVQIAGARGSYGAPGEPGAMVDEAMWQPAADPANPFPVSVQL